jgi:hypothetical protein
MKRIFHALLLGATLAPTSVAADAVIGDWIGEYSMIHDGIPGRLTIADSKKDCRTPPWCHFILSYVTREGERRSGRVERIEDRFQHMVFSIQFPGNLQRFDAYLMSWDKTKMAGTTMWEGRTFGFYAAKSSASKASGGLQASSQPGAQGQPRRSVRPDGTVEAVYPDGTRRLSRPGQCGSTTIRPDGTSSSVQCSQVPSAAFPSPPDGVTQQWLEAHNESLMGVLRAYLDQPGINNYLSNFERGDVSIYEKIGKRTDLILQLSSVQ